MTTLQTQLGEYVWVKPQNAVSEFAVPFGARIIRTDKTQTLVADDENNQIWVPSSDLVKAMHPSSHDGVDDMITLGDLQEYAILRNLEKRYKMQEIYTYTGTMLIAINPYQQLTIYTESEINLYRNKKINVLPPHIFAVSDNAFRQLQRDRANQCVVISGESGAGKTESTKLILQYLAAMSGKNSWIEQQIIEANPLMEAFGNAKTVRNDNSSRFGKYIDIRFTDAGSIQGAKIEQYLLEKSRIVRPGRDERNYHIFYALLEGLSKEERKKLHLTDSSPSSFHYLAQGEILDLSPKKQMDTFNTIKNAMQTLTFKSEETWSIFTLLAAILHLGNVNFETVEVRNMEVVVVANKELVKVIASLLNVSYENLSLALVQRTIYVQKEKVVSSLNKETAVEARDAFVKSLYGAIFDQIVKRINDSIDKKHSGKPLNSIGVLDIFGFENFADNSFEQLCINYANENLQQFFVKHIFKMEQAEYENDGIKWNHIDFEDNQEILDVVGMKPVNIMSLIDEESRFPKGTDLSLLEKMNENHGHRSLYVKPKGRESIFGIRHYAGVVMYNTNGFLEKNRDTFSCDLRDVVSHSKNKYLKEIFPKDSSTWTFSSGSNSNLANKRLTLSLKFRNSLESLMKTLSAAHPFFIRCIKPNEEKKPNQFDRELCIRQLRYSGMMETARIRRAGYPIRHTYLQFVERYRLFIPGPLDISKADVKAVTAGICKRMLPAEADYQFGSQKVFLKSREDNILEMERSKIILKSIVTLQRGFRRVILRRRIQKANQAATVIQRAWRHYRARRTLMIARHGLHRLAACIASRHASSHYKELRDQIERLQSFCRGFLYRKDFNKKFGAQMLHYKELRRIRTLEEERLKQAGNPNWKAITSYNYHQRLKALNLPPPLHSQQVPAGPPAGSRKNSIMDNAAADAYTWRSFNYTNAKQRQIHSATTIPNTAPTTNGYSMSMMALTSNNLADPSRVTPRQSFSGYGQNFTIVGTSPTQYYNNLNMDTGSMPTLSMQPTLIRNQPQRNYSNRFVSDTAIKSQRQTPVLDFNNSKRDPLRRVAYNQRGPEVDSLKVVDDVFDFLNDSDFGSPSTPTPPIKPTNVREKSLMFERELLTQKKIPMKLLSRPVNQYSGETPARQPVLPAPNRRYASQTRL